MSSSKSTDATITSVIPSVLLADCWTLISAEKKKLSAHINTPEMNGSFTPAYLRSVYNRFDADRDGRLSMDEIHSVFNVYMNDLLGEDEELPRSFTEAIARAILQQDRKDYITWLEFSEGFAVAVRQRKALWEQYTSRTDLRVDTIRETN